MFITSCGLQEVAMTTGLVFVSWEASWASDAEEGHGGRELGRKDGKEGGEGGRKDCVREQGRGEAEMWWHKGKIKGPKKGYRLQSHLLTLHLLYSCAQGFTRCHTVLSSNLLSIDWHAQTQTLPSVTQWNGSLALAARSDPGQWLWIQSAALLVKSQFSNLQATATLLKESEIQLDKQCPKLLPGIYNHLHTGPACTFIISVHFKGSATAERRGIPRTSFLLLVLSCFPTSA